MATTLATEKNEKMAVCVCWRLVASLATTPSDCTQTATNQSELRHVITALTCVTALSTIRRKKQPEDRLLINSAVTPRQHHFSITRTEKTSAIMLIVCSFDLVTLNITLEAPRMHRA